MGQVDSSDGGLSVGNGKTSILGVEACFSNQAAHDCIAPGGDAPGTDDSVKAENRGTSGVEASVIIGCIKAADHDKAEFQDTRGTGSAVGQAEYQSLSKDPGPSAGQPLAGTLASVLQATGRFLGAVDRSTPAFAKHGVCLTNLLQQLVFQLGAHAPPPSTCERACSILAPASLDIGKGIALSK
ncbi:MAG: hypothetical protein ACKPKO_49180, partial [Candidatus Fonsibacter sp.]